MTKTAILLVDCPDCKGLIAALVNFLVQQYDVNIVDSDQHRSEELGLAFIRVEFTTDHPNFDEPHFRTAIEPIASAHGMNWNLSLTTAQPNVCLFVSQYLHCIADLLERHSSGELRCHIPLIIGNHETARPLAEFYKIPFHYFPVEPSTKMLVETRQLALLAEHKVDLVVLARYMQILSPRFVDTYPRRIINIHHSLLPAFIGARAYQAAYARGVKLIGATSHYVTEALDEGPIIEQDVARISHSDQFPSLMLKARNLERLVLARAVQWHLESRILCYANKTVIFA